MDLLEKANLYQEEHARKGMRPQYHFTAPIGWLNDPNGFSIFDNRIHLFYQYHPFLTIWSYMYWGHAVSDDLVHWKDLPVALAPDKPYDSAGCFSGSAIGYQGRQALLYTGVEGDLGRDMLPRGAQQQCLAFGNGLVYEKYAGNPVIPTAQLPDGYLKQDFRDPNVWAEPGRYWMIAAAGKDNGLGALLLYDSPDLEKWTYHSVLLENDGSYGTMWECPDLFLLGDCAVVLISVIRMPEGNPEIHSNNPVLAFTGSLTWPGKRFIQENVMQLDCGRDFYATQTLQMPDGRRLLIAWMQDVRNLLAPAHLDWQGMMTFPRELSIAAGRIRQIPAREIEAFRTDPSVLDHAEISGCCSLPGIEGRSLDITVEVEEMEDGPLEIAFAKGDSSEAKLIWNPENRELTFDRSQAADVRDAWPVQSFTVLPDSAPLKLRILLDLYSAEVFVCDGLQTFTAIYYAPPEAQKIAFSCSGRARLNITKYTIHPA